MPQRGVSSVEFPIVGPRGVELRAVHVERLRALDRNERFAIAPGFPDLIDILMDARAAENGAGRLDGVTVVFDGKGFAGKSYGLALAIADRRVRAVGATDGRLIATGIVVERGRGSIGGVEGFAAKAEAVIAAAACATEPVAFAFPAANWDAADAALREALDAAARDGRLALHRCATLADARALWQPRNPRRRAMMLAAGVGALLLVLLGATLTWRYQAGAAWRACRADIATLPDQDPPPAALATALHECARAADAAPDNGHAHFLLGQLRALDHSEALAQASWRRAAELGDRDGMAAHGRALWQASPNDPRQRAMARRWLDRAVRAGSAAAAEDIGYMLIDAGQAASAQAWLGKARAMRAAAEGGK